MPIINYEKAGETARETLLTDDTISTTNKEALRDFFKAYDVSPARMALFSKHIALLLRETDDIRRDMQDRQKINAIFSELRNKISPSYYATAVNVALRFTRWLNDGERPKGFKDIKNLSKQKQKRDLRPEDMVSWEDGLKMAQYATSNQWKAIILTQLDGGFRPSEFHDLNFGDITRKGKFFVAHISKGKTGSRDVILFKCSPALDRWLREHPTKQKEAPLWVMEAGEKSRIANRKGGVIRYRYPALSKRLRYFAVKAGIPKPADFYNLRHSAATLAKKDNLSPDLAAAKFGHSVEYYVNVYGRLSTDDNVKRYSKAYGELQEESEQKDRPIICHVCEAINAPGCDMCEKCNSPLTIKKALEIENAKDTQYNEVKAQLSEINKKLRLLDLAKQRGII